EPAKGLLAHLHETTPFLLVLATVLPAVVANLNGIRFQSECRRLAERSAIMRTILGGHLDDKQREHKDHNSWKRVVRLMRVVRSLKPKSGDPLPDKYKGGIIADALKLEVRLAENAADKNDLRTWAPHVLDFTESAARVFLREVAEWSVLYAKELPEP